jgi:hypothetical protein
MAVVKGFWKFNPGADFTEAQAAQVAAQINAGRFPDTKGERFYKVMGWEFDVGNVPYLVQYEQGAIHRHWARCIGALRRSLHLTRGDRVVADPFVKGGS